MNSSGHAEAYLNVQYALQHAFMVDGDNNVLDVSYSLAGKEMTIQVVMLEGNQLLVEIANRVTSALPDFTIAFNYIQTSAQQFNERKGEWELAYYKWLPFLVFSKAEVL
jgi:hypothetical protein